LITKQSLKRKEISKAKHVARWGSLRGGLKIYIALHTELDVKCDQRVTVVGRLDNVNRYCRLFLALGDGGSATVKFPKSRV